MAPGRANLEEALKNRTYELGVNFVDDQLSIVRPAEKILSISGDGGFLYSAMELETAVRLKANIVHMVWIDGTYEWWPLRRN
jgi:hypothetical protein